MTMTQIMLPAVFSRKDFDNILRSMSDEDAASFAATNRTTFASCFSLSAPGGGTADARAASPGPAKAREPKAAPTVDKGAAASAVFAYVRAFPNVRAEEVEVMAPDGMDAKAWNRMLRGILEKFVTDGKMYADGERRGRRYKVAAKAEPEVAAE